jgi:predicted outer membrane repeat protein
VPATLINVSVINNHSTSSGGGINTSGDITLVNVVMDGNSAVLGGGALTNVGSRDVVASGSIFRNNTAGDGGALLISGSLNMDHVLLIDNSAGSGGAAYVTGTVSLSDTDFIHNAASADGGGALVAGSAAITGGMFVANEANRGAGVLASGDTRVERTLFRLNSAQVRGGGLDVITATVSSTRFDRNQTTAGNGGGLSARNVLSLSDSLFTGNLVLSGTAPAGSGTGGGVFADGVATTTNNIFFGNFAERLGGGMDADFLDSHGDVFHGNLTGRQGSGGGLFVAAPFVLDSAQFFTNTANTGGGLGVNSTASGSVVNSLFVRNVVTFADGGSAMRLLSSSGTQVLHNTIVGIPQAGRAAIHIQGSGTFSLHANIFARHARGISNFSGLTQTEDYNLYYSVTTPFIGPMFTGTHSLNADPQFADALADNYHLLPGSPAIDAAPSFGVLVDHEGHARPFGAAFDLGFDEAQWRSLFLPLIRR